MRKFKCKKCKCSELNYQQYVQSLSPVMIDQNGLISYSEPIYDDNKSLAAEYGYVCKNCGHFLYHAGHWIETEEHLIYYLTQEPEILQKEEEEFEEYAKFEAEQQDNNEIYYDEKEPLDYEKI